MNVRVYPPEEMIECEVELPLSKSISNRSLVMDALTPSGKKSEKFAECDDTAALIAGLASPDGDINVGPAGTAMRFLTAYYAAKPGAKVTIDGNERMRQRPIGALVDALRQCGADITYAGAEGFPPLAINGKPLHGGRVVIDATISSQFASALLMVAPTFDSPLTIEFDGEISSEPYLKMTLEMMRRRGIAVEYDGREATVAPGQYLAPSRPEAERDWSAASYWYEIAAISAGWVTLRGMTMPSLQGDSKVAELYEKIGVITEMEDGNACLNPSPEVFSRLDADLSGNPDLAQALAVTCCMLGIPFRLKGLASLRIKETDRLEALRTELAKLSFDVEIDKDTLAWQMQRVPVQAIEPIECHGDHRMAMAFAPAGTFLSGLKICGAETVSKSYPGFWDDMRAAGYRIEEEA